MPGHSSNQLCRKFRRCCGMNIYLDATVSQRGSGKEQWNGREDNDNIDICGWTTRKTGHRYYDLMTSSTDSKTKGGG